MVELRDVEPFYGWLDVYDAENDPNSPFHEVVHSEFEYDRYMNNIPVHPLWDDIQSDSLLVKVLYADYERAYAIIELFGEWNDLYQNDFKLLAENCLTYFVDAGINQFILVAENVFNGYFEADDYYEAMQDELGSGWMCLLRLRPSVAEELEAYHIGQYFFRSEICDEAEWRKMKPFQLYTLIRSRLRLLLQ